MALSVNMSWLGGLSGSYSAYVAGGVNGTAVIATANKMPYASEIASAQASANLSQAREGLPYVGITNKTIEKGFFLGGYIAGQVATADRCAYSTDTTSAVAGANLTTNRGYSMGNVQNAINGYAMGGGASNVSDKVIWAGETTSALASANLSSNRGAGGGGSTLTSGYTLGGAPDAVGATTVVATCDKLDFTTGNNNNVAGGALVASRGGGCSFNSLV